MSEDGYSNVAREQCDPIPNKVPCVSVAPHKAIHKLKLYKSRRVLKDPNEVGFSADSGFRAPTSDKEGYSFRVLHRVF